jgi:hypothetical protein
MRKQVGPVWSREMPAHRPGGLFIHAYVNPGLTLVRWLLESLSGKYFAPPLPINIYPRRSSRKLPFPEKDPTVASSLWPATHYFSATREKKSHERGRSESDGAYASDRLIGFGILYLWLEATRAPCRWMIAFVWLCTFIYKRHRVSTCDLRKGFPTLRATW